MPRLGPEPLSRLPLGIFEQKFFNAPEIRATIKRKNHHTSDHWDASWTGRDEISINYVARRIFVRFSDSHISLRIDQDFERRRNG